MHFSKFIENLIKFTKVLAVDYLTLQVANFAKFAFLNAKLMYLKQLQMLIIHFYTLPFVSFCNNNVAAAESLQALNACVQ